MTLCINPFIQCIGGHAVRPAGNLEAVCLGIRYITLLRDPVRRYVSQYRQWVEVMGKTISFEEFLETEEVANFQTKKIAGGEDVALAKDILLNRFLLVGLVEQFDEFLVLLSRKLRPMVFDPTYRTQNVSRDKSTSDRIVRRHHAKIVKKNKLDIELYDFVKKEIVPANIRWYGNGFSGDVDRFKRGRITSARTVRTFLDYAFRKLYVEPVGSMIRILNGLPGKGSY